MMRHRGGAGRRESLEDPMRYKQQQEDNMSDDDNANAAPEMQSEAEMEVVEKEDPLQLAIEDLEGRIVAAMDDFKVHPGVRSSSAPGSPTIHEELAMILRPVLEVAAHTGPSVARTYYPVSATGEGVEASCEDVYRHIMSDLVLPVMLESAQSDTIASKRSASLEFFHNLWKECHKAGSWLDIPHRPELWSIWTRRQFSWVFCRTTRKAWSTKKTTCEKDGPRSRDTSILGSGINCGHIARSVHKGCFGRSGGIPWSHCRICLAATISQTYCRTNSGCR